MLRTRPPNRRVDVLHALRLARTQRRRL